ncbi:sporulation sigma factor SigK [Zongyangia hominis]|uniref:Sporulation sigma factor SigK n=1 Tax=Zongyangia hominis TaxID=2763677 RepID=A0A926IBX9_9FIRM|nr:sporulation sigma factor SigK [Zongyangia hominis]MBC8570753.1 sporulation sigma factor SigK [Zongyangia hominis]
MYSLLICFALCNLLYFALHITGNGTFPKPLSAKEEQECLERMAQGDPEARDQLIEHNLRLVAHIIKNG